MRTPVEPRLRRRRRLIWASVLPALVLLVLAVRLLTLPVNIGTAQEAHGEGDGDGMVGAGESLGILNIVERWRAPFVEGTGESMSGDLAAGRSLLEEALERTSTPEDDCTVRTNLVITVSQQADRAGEDGDTQREKELAEEGLALIEDGPQGCLNGQRDGNGGEAGRKQQEQQEKLEEQSGQKKKQQQPDDSDKEGKKGKQQKQQDDPADPKREELEKRNQQGQQQSEQNRRQSEGNRSGGGGGGVEKPW